MTAEYSSKLAALAAAYGKSVLFEEAVPKPYRLAKLFTDMRWSGGGLVLLGVAEGGRVLGIEASELNAMYSRFEHLCAELTETRVRMGTLHLGEKIVVFLVFNTLPKNVVPLDRYSAQIERVATL